MRTHPMKVCTECGYAVREDVPHVCSDTGPLYAAADLGLTAEPASPVWSRWRAILKTSPSGNRLFVCLSCGRISKTPDKRCSTNADPDECEQLWAKAEGSAL